MIDMAFLVGLLGHINTLDVQLQDHILFKIWDRVKGFRANLDVLKRHYLTKITLPYPEKLVMKAGLMIMNPTRKWLVTVIS